MDAVVMGGFDVPVPVLVLGLIVGMTYGILAVGLVLIYRSNRIVNFAHGETGTFAATVFGLWVVRYGLPYWVVFPAALALGAGVSMVIEVVAVRRLRRAPAVMSLVATLGAAAFLLLASYAINAQIRRGSDFPQPPAVPLFDIGALRVTPAYSAMLLLTPLLVLAIVIFLRTRYGIAIRASAGNRDAALMAGISASRMSSLAWAIAGVVSAYTAILQFPQRGFVVASESLGPGLLTRALAAAVIARMDSLPRALAAGVGVGVIEQVLLWNNPVGGQVEVVLFLLILAALLLQNRQGSREAETGSWVAVQPAQPLPERVRSLWLVRNLGRITLVVGVVLLGLVALTTSRTALVFTIMIGYTLVGLSVYVVTGLSGQLSLGQFALAGVGAAASYHLVHHGSGFVVGLLGAGIAAAVVAMVIGIPALRIRGLMLAVTTLSFAVMAESWLFQQPWMLGAGVDPDQPTLFGATLTSARAYYALVLPVLVLALWLTWNISRGGVGRALVALRDNEDGARAFSLPATRLKLQAFALAGALAGVGGAVFAHGLTRITATTFPAGASITVVAMAVIGGLSLLAGPFIGALYLVVVPALLPLDAAALAASTLGWLILILYFPGGFAQVVGPLRRRLIAAIARRAGIDLEQEDADPPPLEAESPGVALRRRDDGRAGPVVPDRLLEVRELSKSYGGIRAVSEVDLEVRRGETLGIIGANGAGKTTLFELIGGFTRPDHGTVVFDYLDVTHATPEQRARLGLVRSFQDARLFPTLSVLECVRLSLERDVPTPFTASILGTRGAGRLQRSKDLRARELVGALGLWGYRDKRINELSTGTRRITELACIAALAPALLLLDEPSSGIAQRETEALGALLTELKDLLGATYVIIEHDMPLISGISDRLVAMEAGKVIASGEPAAVLSDRRVIESYLGGDTLAIERSGTRTDGTKPRCVATTRSGARCRRGATHPGGRCRQHQRLEPIASPG